MWGREIGCSWSLRRYEKDGREGPSGRAGVKIVEGNITELVAWERRWVTFEVNGGRCEFGIIILRQWS